MLNALEERFIEIDFIRYIIYELQEEGRERRTKNKTKQNKNGKKIPSNDLTVGNLLSL